MPLPGFPSNIVNWPWQVTPGLIEAKVFTFLDADGDPYDPGVVTAKAKDGTISATVTGTGDTRTVTWSAEQTDLIPATHWRLNFGGRDQLGGHVGIAQPEDDADLTSEWTIQLPGDGDGLTVTVAGTGGSGAQFAASVILHTDSLTPSNGDALYWVAYTPGHVDAGGPGGSQRVQNDWEVVEAYEWGDETWEPPAGGTDVLLLMGEDSWPTVFATATPDALTPTDVPGLTVVPLGCGGSSGTTGTALWVARNFDGFEGAPSPDEPATDFVPVVTLAQSVITRAWTGRLEGLDQNVGAVLDALDEGDVGGPEPDRPVLKSADWWHRHGPHSTVLVDRGPLHEHGVFDVAPPPIPDGTYLLAPIPGVQSTRPRVPHHARLAFADGVRIIACASLGMVDGWAPLNGTGYSDVLFHQSTGTDGVRDAIEPGIRNDEGERRFFVDNTHAGASDLVADEHQDYSAELTADQYFGVIDWMVEIDFPSGTTRRYRWYLPDPEGAKLTPGEAVEAWTLFDEVTRTAPPGFYIDAELDWILGDQPSLTKHVRMFDLPTEDLALAFDPREATAAGWTDEAGNEWSVGVPIQIVTAADGIVLPSVTIPATAADPGAGSWSMAFHGIIDPARYVAGQASLVGTTTDIQSDPGWMFAFAPPEYGGVLFAVGDGTDYAATSTGIDDCAKHTVVATVDRVTDLLYVSVDGVELTPADISAVGTITGDDLATVYGTVIDDFALYGRALTLAERAAVSAELVA